MPRYHRIYIDGTLADGAERWSVSFATNSGAIVPTNSELQEWALAIAGYFTVAQAPQASLKGMLSSAATITRVRIYSYPDPGEPADRQATVTPTPIAGAGTPTLPPQCSMVVTLETGIPGRSYRGRFYWPLAGGAVTAAQRTALGTQAAANAFADLLNSVLGEAGTLATRIVVASEKMGTLTPVSSVRIDNVVDTQRRRRDKLFGTSYSSNLV